MNPLVYVAGPYTTPEPVENTRRAIDAWEVLTKAGFVAYVPHTNLLLHLCYPRPADFWYEYDLEILARCDYLLRLPGESVGADREVEFAYEHGIPVYEGTANEFAILGPRIVEVMR